MRAGLHDLPGVQDADLIVGLDGAEAMGDGNNRPRGAEHTQRLLYLLLRLGVQSRGGFIQHLCFSPPLSLRPLSPTSVS